MSVAGYLRGQAEFALFDYLDRLPIVVLTLAAQDVDLDADPDTAPTDDSAAASVDSAD